MKCNHCDKEINKKDAKYCPSCGKKIDSITNTWWWRLLQIAFGLAIAGLYLALISAVNNPQVPWLAVLAFFALFVASGATLVRAGVYYIIFGASEEVYKSLKIFGVMTVYTILMFVAIKFATTG